ncbi:MAG TPA: transposase, partial [Thermoanaerobaculia bacterium]|nr:transposase [Thermoanaerobaculia bacterium]
MTECTEQRVLFSIGRREVTTVFDGGSVTSDAGVLLLSGIDRELGLTRRLAAALGDRRDPSKVRHEMEELLRQRLFQICCGYEDVNDAGTLREDPGFQVAVGRVPGQRGSNLASQPTLSRLEVTARRRQLVTFSEVLTGEAIRFWQGLGRKVQRTIILDFDSTDDPTYGDQQLTMFHG